MKSLSFILTFLIILSCTRTPESNYVFAENSEFELYKPKTQTNATLILFGGYSETVKEIKREFKILKESEDKSIAVAFSKNNQKIWLEENELEILAEQLQKLFEDNKLSKNKIHFGGFSSGGNIALLMGNYLIENKKFGVEPHGIFIIDSPVDLAGLYWSAEKNLERNHSKPVVEASKMIIKTLGDRFGNPDQELPEYEKHSVYTNKTGNIENVKNLKNTKIRMYSEPDTLWWKENSGVNYQQLNSYSLDQLAKKLNTLGFREVKYIPTKNRGYRSNGVKHPHSWSIAGTYELLAWVLKD